MSNEIMTASLLIVLRCHGNDGDTYVIVIVILQLCCTSGISPMGNSGCFPRGKIAAAESCYPTYSACLKLKKKEKQAFPESTEL